MVWLAFWGAVAVQRSASHISVSAAADLMPRSWQLPLHLASDLVVAAALCLLAWYGWVGAWLSLDQQTVGLGVTLAIFAFAVPVCSALMLLCTLDVMRRRLTGSPLDDKLETVAEG